MTGIAPTLTFISVAGQRANAARTRAPKVSSRSKMQTTSPAIIGNAATLIVMSAVLVWPIVTISYLQQAMFSKLQLQRSIVRIQHALSKIAIHVHPQRVAVAPWHVPTAIFTDTMHRTFFVTIRIAPPQIGISAVGWIAGATPSAARVDT